MNDMNVRNLTEKHEMNIARIFFIKVQHKFIIKEKKIEIVSLA